ncbi:Hypothetical protein CKL_2089 [Clostridium kluyveri DSM 555]|uniref:Uncharacterized protein n=1 Tax=Clostridium kluyveri (strain ATCC 8527 / DSM 555 / NBRC 12016 / NCIMB 10680 / K1) TaxID=431943 RepID=A5MZ05_CLOK5|nr:Hypothetical protein CKL_2089 [Clostridium kluyveri DSM 555]
MNLDIPYNRIFYNTSTTDFYFDGTSFSKLDLTLSASNINFLHDISEIFDEVHIQYGYIKELLNSANPDDPEFIENYALRYVKIRSKISKE